MVYQAGNQLVRYHDAPQNFLTTSQHFHDHPGLMEVPNGGPHKTSTHALLYAGAPHVKTNAVVPKKRAGQLGTTGDLDRAPPPRQDTLTRTAPSGTYRGQGTFVVELPHSTITYPNPKMVPYKDLAWRTEYKEKFMNKKPYEGYHTLTSRWTRPPTETRKTNRF